MEDKILKFIQISVPEEAIMNIIDVVAKNLSLNSEIPEKVWNDCKDLYDINELHRRLVPIYLDYFKEDEIDYILEFLQSPLAEKYVSIINSGAKFKEVNHISESYMNEVVSAIMLKVEMGGYD